MLNHRTIKIILLYLFISVLLLLGVYIPSIPLRFFDALIILGSVAIMQAWYKKKYELKSLAKEYDNQQKMLSDIFKYSPDLIFYKDNNLQYVGYNEAFAQTTYPYEDLIGKTDFDILPAETAEAIRVHDAEVLKNKRTIKYEQNIILPSGEERVFEIIKTPMPQDGQTKGILGISRDITEMHNLQQSRLKTQSQLTAILENMPYIAYLKDLEGKIIIGNNKIKEYLSLSIDTTGMQASEFFSKDHADEIKEEDIFILKEKRGMVVKKQITTSLGTFWFEINKAPIFDENGEVAEIVVVAKNIDAERTIELQKENFIATLTHDLKTPTTAQIRALKLLLEGTFGELTKDQAEITLQTLNSCKYMANMISIILTTYKHDQGQLKLNIEKYNFKELVEDSCNEVFYLCNEKNQILSVSADLLDEFIQADKLEIKRVVVNLISNAIAYAIPNSKIDIFIKEDAGNLSFTVRNKGSVLSKEELSTLFNRYVSNASKYKQVGTGLGLYLSKQIIEQHGGKMFASSDEENGTSFGFSLSKSYKYDEFSLNN